MPPVSPRRPLGASPFDRRRAAALSLALTIAAGSSPARAVTAPCPSTYARVSAVAMSLARRESIKDAERIKGTGGGLNSQRTEAKLWSSEADAVAFVASLEKLIQGSARPGEKLWRSRDPVAPGRKPETHTLNLQGVDSFRNLDWNEVSRLAEELGVGEDRILIDLAFFAIRGVDAEGDFGRQTDRLRVVGDVPTEGGAINPAVITPVVPEGVRDANGAVIEPGQWVSFEPKQLQHEMDKSLTRQEAEDAGLDPTDRLNKVTKKTLVINARTIDAVVEGRMSFEDFLRINKVGNDALSRGIDLTTGRPLKVVDDVPVTKPLIKDTYDDEVYTDYMRKVFTLFRYKAKAKDAYGAGANASKYNREAKEASVPLDRLFVAGEELQAMLTLLNQRSPGQPALTPDSGVAAIQARLREVLAQASGVKPTDLLPDRSGKISFQVTLDRDIRFFRPAAKRSQFFGDDAAFSVKQWYQRVTGKEGADLDTVELKIDISHAKVMDEVAVGHGQDLLPLVRAYYGPVYEAYRRYIVDHANTHAKTMSALGAKGGPLEVFSAPAVMYMAGKGALFRLLWEIGEIEYGG